MKKEAKKKQHQKKKTEKKQPQKINVKRKKKIMILVQERPATVGGPRSSFTTFSLLC